MTSEVSENHVEKVKKFDREFKWIEKYGSTLVTINSIINVFSLIITPFTMDDNFYI